MEDIVFRKLKDSDLEILKNFCASESVDDFTFENFRGFLEETKHQTNTFALIGILNNQIICISSVFIEIKTRGKKVVHIEDVYVTKNHRGMGVGYKLLEELRSEVAQAQGCYKMTLTCAQENIEFYKKCGFVLGGFEMNAYLKSI